VPGIAEVGRVPESEAALEKRHGLPGLPRLAEGFRVIVRIVQRLPCSDLLRKMNASPRGRIAESDV
jgi:hypothetical protein